MENKKQNFLHKGTLDFEVISPNAVEDLEDHEIIQSIEDKVVKIKESPSVLLDNIEIQESYLFDYDDVNVDELLSDTGSITPHSI